jgi:N-formylglutamate deformylase
MDAFHFSRGDSPLLLSIPHCGTHIPPELAARMTSAALRVPDTDWHLPRLYDFAGELGASVLAATHSRYVIDLNRPEDDANLYPGQDTTGLVPRDTFAKEALYAAGREPADAEISARKTQYWRPYHAQLASELARIKAQHGYALLWDAHSIASQVPRFFSGKLTDLNLGTAGGTSCGAGLGEALLDIAKQERRYSAVLNGRFKGGYITRRYGAPAAQVHAVQLELSWAAYMDETWPYAYRVDLAEQVRPLLLRLLETMLNRAKKPPRQT